MENNTTVRTPTVSLDDIIRSIGRRLISLYQHKINGVTAEESFDIDRETTELHRKLDALKIEADAMKLRRQDAQDRAAANDPVMSRSNAARLENRRTT